MELHDYGKQIQTLAAEGRDALNEVRSFPSDGRAHLDPGQTYNYEHRFPTSGPHDPQPVEPGVYTESQPPTKLVHALEHGNIVIYYDEPAPKILNLLRTWAEHHDGKWSGLVLTPESGLGDEIVLTAWTKMLRLDPFDRVAAAAFIDTYRGRGPEHPVDRDHTVMRDAALELEYVAKALPRQRPQHPLLFGKRLADHTAGGAVDAYVGNICSPAIKLRIQIGHVVKHPTKKKVLTNVPIRAFDPIRGRQALGRNP